MVESHRSRPGAGQWLLFLILAGWLALVPLAVTGALSALTGLTPEVLAAAGLATALDPALPQWAFGLLAAALTLGLNLLAFVPLYFATRQPRHEFLHTTAILLIAIALVQSLNALAGLVCHALPEGEIVPIVRERTCTAALRLALVLPFLLFVLGWIEAQRQGSSLVHAWRRVGLRLWANPSTLWLALGAGAVIVWPWVLVGSLGSPGTTAANALQALPNALNEEILFRGIAFAWLWRAARNRTGGAVGSLLLFVAAQGGTVLPGGDWGALLRFGAALCLGLLLTELAVRGGGSIWPAVIVHFVYNWFHFAFVDPRSDEEVWHWLVQFWAPLAAGGLGLLLWFGRKILASLAPSDRVGEREGAPAGKGSRAGLVAAVGFALISWGLVLLLYLTAGVPGFHPDGLLVYMEEQADLAPAAAIADPAERRAWVYQELVETAERSQASLRAELERRGVAYRAHYLVNALEVLERPGLRRRIAREPGVDSVLFQPGMRRYPNSFSLPDMDVSGPSGVEWNVREVGADRAWELGYTGQGMVAGTADTGVAWQHPALKEAYRGWDGTAASHDYHWYDPWDGSAEPWDDNGHGTHTTGTVLGRDGDNRVGIAPGAQWIACRNMRHGIGNPGSYLSCMEFLFAPFALGGDPLRDGDPARGAHVTNNSWGCPRQEGCLPDTLRIAVDNLRAGGQMMVAGAGNEGPGCGSVEHVPATYDAVFSVGAIDHADRAAGFSSRGPVTVDGSGRPKPDIAAPGVDVRSSVPDGYASLPGTSMASPHVAGAVALLWSAEPALVGDVARTEALLAGTAQPLTVDAVCADGSPGASGAVCGCGGDGPDSVPNHVYGWGQVDVWAALQRLLEQ